MLENLTVNSNNNNHSILSQQKVEEYIKSITDEQNIKGMIYQNMIQQQQQHQHQLQQHHQYQHRNGHQTLTNEKVNQRFIIICFSYNVFYFSFLKNNTKNSLEVLIAKIN